MFYLIRHGETDMSQQGSKIYQGYGKNFNSLTQIGLLQIKETAKDPRLAGTNIILSSPYTRALQSAAILSKELQVDIAVETDIHEWVADKSYNSMDIDESGVALQEFNEYNGMYPHGAERLWEDHSILRNRLHKTLNKYMVYNKVIVVCHGMLIHSVSNGKWLQNAEIYEYNFIGGII